jgi:hypothetical protein
MFSAARFMALLDVMLNVNRPLPGVSVRADV